MAAAWSVTVTRNYANGLGFGDYADKARTHRALMARTKFPENAAHYRSEARRYASICRAIWQQFRPIVNEHGIYFDVSRVASPSVEG